MLLVRPIPYSGESAMGYVRRLSDANGLESPRRLNDIDWQAGMRWTGGSEGRELRGPITGLAGLNAHDPGGIGSRYWNTRRPRYCPQCLEERQWWPAYWQLVFAVACDRHRVALLDECPACRQPLRWDRGTLLECRCGESLRLARTHEATPYASLLAQQIRCAFDRDQEGLRTKAPANETVAVLQRVWLIGAFSCGTGRKPQKIADLHRIDIAERMVEAAGLALEDWPHGFYRFLEQLEQRCSDRGQHRLSLRFGPLYREVFAKNKNCAFDDLRTALESFIGERWQGQLGLRNRRLPLKALEDHQWVPATRAAKEIGWKSQRIRSAIERGVIRGQMHRLPSGRISAVVHRLDLERLKSESSQWLTLRQACAAFHRGKRAIRALVDHGHLVPAAGPSVDGHSIWQFRREDLAQSLNADVSGPIIRLKTAGKD